MISLTARSALQCSGVLSSHVLRRSNDGTVTQLTEDPQQVVRRHDVSLQGLLLTDASRCRSVSWRPANGADGPTPSLGRSMQAAIRYVSRETYRNNCVSHAAVKTARVISLRCKNERTCRHVVFPARLFLCLPEPSRFWIQCTRSNSEVSS